MLNHRYLGSMSFCSQRLRNSIVVCHLDNRIAFLLGFDEVDSFTRALQVWARATPLWGNESCGLVGKR